MPTSTSSCISGTCGRCCPRSASRPTRASPILPTVKPRWPGIGGPKGWPALVGQHTNSIWCFGSMRMFLDRRDDFTGWKLAQDVVWEKHNGTGFAADRFRRVHEIALHYYQGDWRSVHHDTPRQPAKFDAHRSVGQVSRTSRKGTQHTGAIGSGVYEEDGFRLARSVLRSKSVRGGIHPTEKPGELLDSLIRYACPEGGLVLDPFAGSASTLYTVWMRQW